MDENSDNMSSKPEAQSVKKTESNGSCFGTLLGCVLCLAGIIFLGWLAVDRFSYQSIRFPDNSENPELIDHQWWGWKQKAYKVQRIKMENDTLKWMYEDDNESLIKINETLEFVHPFIIRFPWSKEQPKSPQSNKNQSTEADSGGTIKTSETPEQTSTEH